MGTAYLRQTELRMGCCRTALCTLGRFGWKANQPTLLQQVAAAYNDDMGITTSLFSTENSAGQPQLTEHSVIPEVSDEILEVVTFYVQTLAVPARRNVDDPAG